MNCILPLFVYIKEVANMAYSKWLPLSSSAKAPVQMFCSLSNVSVCDTTVNNDDFTITLYNPLGRMVNHWVELPVASLFHQVHDSAMKEVNNSVSNDSS